MIAAAQKREIFGYGIANDVYYRLSGVSYGQEREISNGLMLVLIDFGALGLLFYSIFTFRFIKEIEMDFNAKGIIFCGKGASGRSCGCE